MLRVFLSTIVIFLITTLYSNQIEDIAFREYKNRNYTKALKLYTKAATKRSLKSLLMLGLFFEKGLGVPVNKQKAIKIYKLILKRTSNIKELLKDEKKSKITITALQRLTILTNNKRYLQLANKITQLKKQIAKNEKPHFNRETSIVDDFFILCPFAALVAPEDREGIENFDCALFENFPKRMVLFMRLRRLHFELLNKQEKNFALKLQKIDRKIALLIEPMLKFLQQEALECYQNSETNTDITMCDYDYLLKSDPLLFDNAAYKMEQALNKKSIKEHRLDIFEKNDLINNLIKKISRNEYGKPWRNMVK